MDPTRWADGSTLAILKGALMSALAVVPTMPETVAGLSRRLAELLEESEAHGTQSQLQDGTRAQAADLVEAPRVRIVRKVDRDHRSLFELDDRLIELMVLVEEAPDAGAAISEELAQEIDVYLEAYRHKVDRIVDSQPERERLRIV